MADVLKATRTTVHVSGILTENEKEVIREIFEEERGNCTVMMTISYDNRDDITTILLSPCQYREEKCDDGQKSHLIHRVAFCFEADALSSVLIKDKTEGHNIFIEKVWAPYRKETLEKTVVLPAFIVNNGHVTFDLLSVDTCCEKDDGRRKPARVKPVGTRRRNDDIRKAEKFLLNYFAECIESDSPRTNPTARRLDDISMAISEKVAEF